MSHHNEFAGQRIANAMPWFEGACVRCATHVPVVGAAIISAGHSVPVSGVKFVKNDLQRVVWNGVKAMRDAVISCWNGTLAACWQTTARHYACRQCRSDRLASAGEF